MSDYLIPSYLPGRLRLSRGTARDYDALCRFHYRNGAPATFADVWVVHFHPHAIDGDPRPEQHSVPVAIGVLSYPIPALRAREKALGLLEMNAPQRLEFINRHVRTISRVAVHPTYRSLGLARMLVRCILYHCPTRYVESLAVMGRVHPFLKLAGMKAYPPQPTPPHHPPRPYYYLFDRQAEPVQLDLPWWSDPRDGARQEKVVTPPALAPLGPQSRERQGRPVPLRARAPSEDTPTRPAATREDSAPAPGRIPGKESPREPRSVPGR